MAINQSVEINRSPEDVFAYIDQLDRHGEWQSTIVSVKVETEGPTRVGSRATDKRRVPGRVQDITYEITEHDPPNRASFRGVNGPLRPQGTVTATPLDDGARTRLAIDFDLKSHGFLGMILRPLAMGQARKTIPEDMERLKERLESGEA